jgi:endonuclease III
VAQARLIEILKLLKREYPEAECSLSYKTPFQLLVATILSAQCTDERVNQVTPGLFKRFPGSKKMAQADLQEIEERVKSTGFYRRKARAILESAREIEARYHGKVPRTLDELIKLPGVGRKTANVIIGNAFGIPGLVVDTHVKRLCYRLGFTRSMDPKQIEQEMMELVPRDDWTIFAHLLISHGRQICTARRAYCEKCVISRYCYKVGVV